jgi:hypothetical protein
LLGAWIIRRRVEENLHPVALLPGRRHVLLELPLQRVRNRIKPWPGNAGRIGNAIISVATDSTVTAHDVCS